MTHSFRVTVLVLAVMVVSGPGIVAQEFPEEEISWDGDVGRFESSLCGENAGDAFMQPVFGPVEDGGQFDDADYAVGQRGLIANQDGEVFYLTVVGDDEDALLELTDEIMLCLDVVPTGATSFAELTKSEDGSPEAVEDAGFIDDRADVATEFTFLGILPADNEPIAVVEELAIQYPPEDWVSQLVEIGMVLAVELQDEGTQQHLVHFAVDPSIGSGKQHSYGWQRVECAEVTLSTRSGRASLSVQHLTDNGWVTSSNSHCGSSAWHRLFVYGGDGGARYRVNGTWYRGYYDNPP
jgi:hypothetical protein